MSDALRVVLSAVVGAAVVYAAVPPVLRVARATGFYDKPVGYKGHAIPTPYLGGLALFLGFMAVTPVSGLDRATAFVVGGLGVLWIVGTTDDRRTVGPGLRVLIECALATVLWVEGVRWLPEAPAVLSLAISVLWVLAVINAFNLMDNMDGAASSVGAVCLLATGALALRADDPMLGALGVGWAAACAGFLPANLAGPARIFLGDGGSMPLGFAVAALTMAGPLSGHGVPGVALGLVVIAVAALDTSLVVISRRRRGVSVLTAGRDHLTHRVRRRVASTRAVAATLAGVQAVVAAVAVAALAASAAADLALAAAIIIAGLAVIWWLDTAEWARPVTNFDAPPAVETEERLSNTVLSSSKGSVSGEGTLMTGRRASQDLRS